MPTKEFYNRTRRIHRGLFITNKGLKINADCNGGAQIIRKHISNPPIADKEKLLNLMRTPIRLKVS